MRFDWCKANLYTSCEEHKYDHCEMCNMARAYQHGYETAQEDMSKDAVEVVRCKDCKASRVYGKTTQWLACESVMEGQATDPDGYCYLGERREP